MEHRDAILYYTSKNTHRSQLTNKTCTLAVYL